MFAQRKCHVVEYREIAEQATRLEHHPHFAAQAVKGIVAQLVDNLACHLYITATRGRLTADQAQQGGLAAAAGAQQTHHLATGDGKIESAENLALTVGVAQILDLYQCFRGQCRLLSRCAL